MKNLRRFARTAFLELALLALLAIWPMTALASETAPNACTEPALAGAQIMPLTFMFDAKAEPAEVQAGLYDFMWRTFVALSWPTAAPGDDYGLSRRGEPDADTCILGITGSESLPFAVWETYREPSEVFLPSSRWHPYPTWNTPRRSPGNLADGSRSLLGYSQGFTEYATDIAQPYFFPDATGPLIDRNGNYARYEVAINEAFFTYIRHFRYYDACAQRQAVAAYVADPSSPGAFQRPPHGTAADFAGYLRELPPYARQGLVDVKAAWRQLDPTTDRFERYLHRDIIIDDQGTTVPMGLVALHVLRYVPCPAGDGGCLKVTGDAGTYVAATFEQVDNVEIKFDPQPGLKPSFNDGSEPTQEQSTYGFEGDIPAFPSRKDPRPSREPVDIYRVTPIPDAVARVNERYQGILSPSVFSYYQLIGTQNKHPGNEVSFLPGERDGNGHEGPLTGVFTNTNNLINSTLESYTQNNFSCILCHSRARPLGVPQKADQVDQFKILTFLLQSAQEPTQCPHPSWAMAVSEREGR